MPRGDYEFRARKTAEVGQSFAIDPSFPGRVESVTDKEVVIRFSAEPGSVIETPFGTGRIREEGENYKVDIDAREGKLVRTGNKIGRISKVDDKVIVIDYRHPFGYEALICDVTLNKVTETAAVKDGAAEK
jgi:FKBP-type peptidyl-prolyl cis-trans isomerase 2